jgi:hypothetical protein
MTFKAIVGTLFTSTFKEDPGYLIRKQLLNLGRRHT